MRFELLKAIQSELGEGNELSEEITQLRDKAHKAKMSKPVPMSTRTGARAETTS